MNAAVRLPAPVVLHHVPCAAGNRLPKPIKTDPLILEYRYLARLLAHRFVSRMAGQRDFDELFAVAMEGLWKATKGFEGDKGTEFKTYADTCIYNELEHEQRKVWSVGRRTALRSLSIDADEGPIGALVATTPTPERAYAAIEIARAVLASASERNRPIVRSVLDGDTLDEAGAEAELTGERARQIFEAACEVVRKRTERREKRLA